MRYDGITNINYFGMMDVACLLLARDWRWKNLEDNPMRTIGIVLAKHGDQSEISQQNIGILQKRRDLTSFDQE